MPSVSRSADRTEEVDTPMPVDMVQIADPTATTPYSPSKDPLAVDERPLAKVMTVQRE
jgi:hypothetical protein